MNTNISVNSTTRTSIKGCYREEYKACYAIKSDSSQLLVIIANPDVEKLNDPGEGGHRPSHHSSDVKMQIRTTNDGSTNL